MLKINILEQNESPIRIAEPRQRKQGRASDLFAFDVLNTSDRSVRAIVVYIDKSERHAAIFAFYDFMKPGGCLSSGIEVPFTEFETKDSITLYVDYVLFDDGSEWGQDSRKKSEFFAGEREGIRAVIKDLREIVVRSDFAELSLLNQKPNEIKVPLPAKREKGQWELGFQVGYRNVLIVIQGLKDAASSRRLEMLDKLERIHSF